MNLLGHKEPQKTDSMRNRQGGYGRAASSPASAPSFSCFSRQSSES
jgi:hypothetical protein